MTTLKEFEEALREQGMQMALACRAMRQAMPLECRDLALRSAQMTFVNPLPGGAAIRTRSSAPMAAMWSLSATRTTS